MRRITDENYNAVKLETKAQTMSFMAELSLVGGITPLHGKEYINHEGLQYLAKKQGVRCQKVRAIDWASDPENGRWVVEATVVDKDGHMYTALGDASADNVGPKIRTATLRMAATRATNRCLRKLLQGPGVAMTSAEEIPGAFDSSDPDMGSALLDWFLKQAAKLGYKSQEAAQKHATGTGFGNLEEMSKAKLKDLLEQMRGER